MQLSRGRCSSRGRVLSRVRIPRIRSFPVSCLKTAIAPLQRATFHQTLLVLGA